MSVDEQTIGSLACSVYAMSEAEISALSESEVEALAKALNDEIRSNNDAVQRRLGVAAQRWLDAVRELDWQHAVRELDEPDEPGDQDAHGEA